MTSVGGAIYNTGEDAYIGKIDNVEFTGNMAKYGGAAIGNDNGAHIGTISNTNFAQNWSNDEGGAIRNNNNSTINEILGSTFTNNEAQGNKGYGGAIYNQSGTIGTISGTTFGGEDGKGNKSNEGGGAIYNAATINSIIDSTFSYNKLRWSSKKGGAIYNKTGANIDLISNTKFEYNGLGTDDSNAVAGNGGAIFNESGSTIGESANTEKGIIGGSFIGHKVQYGGGAIFNQGNLYNINGATFSENYSGGFGGGAIKNNGLIETILGSTFTKNSSDTLLSGQIGSRGGAILNESTINSILQSTFKKNTSTDFGGAIANSNGAEITEISADFTKNQGSSAGAINNEGTIGTISNSKFLSNLAIENADYVQGNGGAIRNYQGAKINSIINSVFEDNNAKGWKDEYKSISKDVFGGAVYNANASTIGAIDGVEFKSNTVEAGYDAGINFKGSGYGGAICNAVYMLNDAGTSTGERRPSTITSIGTLDNKNIFTSNKVINSYNSYGGALANGGTIDSVIADFSQNYTSGANLARGGAIYNINGLISNIVGNFTNNYTNGNYAYGGAISNVTSDYTPGAEIDSIKADFIDNYAVASEANGVIAQGGAIYNNGTIREIINSSFKNNYAKALNGIAQGGAIYLSNPSAGLKITADGNDIEFTGNYTEDKNGPTQNAIYSDNGTEVTLNAINSGKITFNDEIEGSSIFNLKLTGDSDSKIVLNNNIIRSNTTLENSNLFIGLTDEAESNVFADSNTSLTAKSGILSFIDGKTSNYNINKLTSNDTSWGIEADWATGKADTITLTSTDSNGEVKLGAFNVLNNLDTNNFEGEKVIQVIVGAAGDKNNANIKLNIDNLDITKLNGELYRTDVSSSTILADIDSDIKLATTDTKDDSISIKGVLYNTLEYISSLETKNGEAKTFTFDNLTPVYTYSGDTLTFVGDLTISGSTTDQMLNFSDKTDLIVKDGATLTVKNSSIKDAKTLTNEGILKTDGAKFTNIKTLTNNAVAEFRNTEFVTESDKIINNKTMTFENSVINAELTNNDKAEMTFKGDSKLGNITNDGIISLIGNSDLNGTISGTDGIINMVKGTQNINNNIANQSIINKGATVNLSDVNFISNQANSLTMNGGLFNIQNLGLNNLQLNALNMHGGAVNISSVDVDLKNSTMGKITAINSQVPTGGTINVNGMKALSDSVGENTKINFADGAFASAVKSNVKSVEAKIYKYDVSYDTSNGNFLFTRAGAAGGNSGNPGSNTVDMYSPSLFVSSVASQVGGYLTQSQTLQDAFYHMNRYTKYARSLRLSAENPNTYAIADTPVYRNSVLPETSSAMWIKPYTAFEKVNLKGGIGVSNVTYGTLYGGDSDLYDLGRGYKGVLSAFVGYNGAHQSYNGISMNQQGGTLGVTGTLYKGNFFTGLTMSAGASAGEAYTSFGRDNFTTLTGGIASKTGYNWEIKEGKVIVQPTLFVGYTFVNTFDYKNAAGVNVQTDALHALQIMPGVKVIGNTKCGWQPYAGIDMVWNIMGQKNVMANDVRLPQLSVKPYVQYGVGVQKSWADRFTAFAQTMIRNGGRNGIVLSLGFRWTLGKNTVDKVDSTKSTRTVLKSL